MHTKNKIVNLEQENACSIGVEVRNLTTNTTFFRYQEKKVISSASCIKLFFAGAILETMHRKNISFSDTLPLTTSHFVPGASILADLKTQEVRIDDLLYLLLAHSDTTAQNTLEQLISPQEINDYIKKQGFVDTHYVSKKNPDKTVFSSTTPSDAVLFMSNLWNKKDFVEENRNLMLSFLAQSRHTYYGLRYLPTSLNMKDPSVTERYSKAGKVYHAINDTLLLITTKGTVAIGVFIDNFIATEKFNSVDNAGILLVAELTRDLFTDWFTSK